MEENTLKRKKLDYRWVIVIVCFAMEFTALGFCSSNKSLYLSAITEALGIERALFSLNDSCRFITTAVVNLFFGFLIMRLGPRKMIAGGFISLIASVLIYSYAENIFVFYLGGALLGLGMSWTTTTMVGYLIGRWCKEKKGTIMGFVMASNGVGGAVAAQIVTPIIYQEGNLFGYRQAYQLIAVLLAIVGTLAVILIKDAPEAGPAVVGKKKSRGRLWVGLSFQEVLHQPFFYFSCAGIFLTGMCLQGCSGISGAHMKDVGLDPDTVVATALSIHSLALAGAKFLTGISYDKLGLRRTMIFCQTAAVIAFTALAMTTSSSTGAALAMVYSIVSAIGLPLETIMLPLISGELFGEKDYAKMMGIFVSVNTAGYAVGAPVANLVFDRCGTYKPILLASAALMIVIGVAFQLILTEAAKVRAEVEARAEAENA